MAKAKKEKDKSWRGIGKLLALACALRGLAMHYPVLLSLYLAYLYMSTEVIMTVSL